MTVFVCWLACLLRKLHKNCRTNTDALKEEYRTRFEKKIIARLM